MKHVVKIITVAYIFTFPLFLYAQNIKPSAPPLKTSQSESKNNISKKNASEVKIEYPKLKKYVAAKYPLKALAEKRDGIVKMKITIDKDGKVINVEVVSSPWKDLTDAAVKAVKQFEFSPAKMNGNPVKVKISLNYPFKLQTQKTNKKPESSIKKETKLKKIKPKSEFPQSESLPKTQKTNPKINKTQNRTKPVKPLISKGFNLSGTVWERGLNKNTDDGEVILYKFEKGKKKKVASTWLNNKGNFIFPLLPSGKYQLLINAPGCKILRKIIKHKTEKTHLDLYVTRYSSNPNNIIVTGLKKRKEVTKYTVTLDEIVNIPGTQGDALKAVQNMPGVARAPMGLGLLIIRGSAPEDSKIFFEGHEIPILYHFLGLTSVINSDLLKSIDFIPGNFSVKYGRAMGGIVDIKLKPPERDHLHGYIDSDIWDTGILLKGPIGKGSFALSFRRSYIDVFLRNITPIRENVGIAPVYYDYQMVSAYPLAGGKFNFIFFGSDDKLILLDYNSTPYHTNFNKFITSWKISKNKNTFSVSVAGGKTKVSMYTPGKSNQFTANYSRVSWRPVFKRKLGKNFKLEIGTPGEYAYADFFLDIQMNLDPNDDSSTSINNNSLIYKDHLFSQAFYTELEWKTGKLTLIPGLRAELFKTDITSLFFADPRFSGKYELISKKLDLRFGVGMYSQPPNPTNFVLDFYGNPNLIPQHAVHFSTGIDWKIRKSLSFKTTGFYKHLYDLVATTDDVTERNGETVNENIDNNGIGRIYGVEFLIKKQNTALCPAFLGMQKCFGWLGYTLMRSERKDKTHEGWYPFDFDQTHILTAIFSGLWRGGWRFGIRFRLTSGNPVTPIIGGIYDADSGRYTPVYGKINSDRLPLFHQLDIRLDKKFVFKHFSLNLYLDVQNAYNYQTSEFMTYNFNYSQKSTVNGLPIVPSLGIKGVW